MEANEISIEDKILNKMAIEIPHYKGFSSTEIKNRLKEFDESTLIEVYRIENEYLLELTKAQMDFLVQMNQTQAGVLKEMLLGNDFLEVV